MKNRLSLLLLLVTFLSFAQNKFESGYYIDNSGKKTECLIKNYDWKNNPTSIETKNTSDDKTKTKTIEEIAEFGITDKSKFIKATVNIDESSQNNYTLTNTPSTKFVERTVMLKVLVEGKSSLYYFENEDYERFFYTVKDKIEQLVYKQYNNDEGNIATNESYKQQLFVNFKCNNDKKSIVALKYKNNDLIDYFIKTNNCLSGNTESKAVSEKRKFETNFKINFLLSNINSSYTRPTNTMFTDLNSKQNSVISFGFETEIILPYNNQKWSFIFDPSYIKDKETINYNNYNYINSEFTLNNDSFTLRLPLGLRRYFRINKNSSLFTNATFSYNLNKTNIYTFRLYNNTTNVLVDEAFTSSSFGLGLGYQYKRYTAEIKCYTKNILYTYVLSGKEYSYNQLSLKLGYKLF